PEAAHLEDTEGFGLTGLFDPDAVLTEPLSETETGGLVLDPGGGFALTDGQAAAGNPTANFLSQPVVGSVDVKFVVDKVSSELRGRDEQDGLRSLRMSVDGV